MNVDKEKVKFLIGENKKFQKRLADTTCGSVETEIIDEKFFKMKGQ